VAAPALNPVQLILCSIKAAHGDRVQVFVPSLRTRLLSSLNYVMIPFDFFRLVSIVMLTLLAAMFVSFSDASLAS